MKLDEKGKKKRRGGFTLVELIVVLVILGILAAIMVPALLGWMDKARNQDAILECRNVVMAAQSQVAEAYGRNPVSKAEMENVLNGDEAVKDILKTASAAGTIRNRSIRLDEKLVLTDLVYTTGAGVRVIYDRNHSPVYRIDDGGKYTADVPGYHAQASDLRADEWDISRFLENNVIKEGYEKYFTNWSEVRDNPTKRFQAAYIEKYGDFPKVDWSQIQLPPDVTLQGGEYDSVWKPVLTKEADGSSKIVMLASKKSEKTDMGAGQAAVVYYNGQYYYHNHTVGNPGKASTVWISDKEFTVDNLSDESKWTLFEN